MNRTLIDYFIIWLKGIAMGAADVVPGVSGGTIAFVSGIYEELIETINKVNFNTLKILKEEGFKSMWQSINGNFLLALLLGIATSILSLAKAVKWLLENKPILVWAFFFGLVLASVIYIAKQIKNWNFVTVLVLISGSVIGYYITILPPMSSTYSSSLFFFLAGSLAICAMILPGISGGFILLLLGAYKPALDALDDKDFKTILLLIGGAIVGLLTFSRLLKWLFDKYRNMTLTILTGFVIGSLNKVWPWKDVLQSEIINGKLKILREQSVSPFTYTGDNQLMLAIIFMVIGFLIILVLERTAVKRAL
jgi:putative membrane protein